MRTLNFLITAVVFSTIFIGIAVVSAVATKAMHELIVMRGSEWVASTT